MSMRWLAGVILMLMPVVAGCAEFGHLAGEYRDDRCGLGVSVDSVNPETLVLRLHTTNKHGIGFMNVAERLSSFDARLGGTMAVEMHGSGKKHVSDPEDDRIFRSRDSYRCYSVTVRIPLVEGDERVVLTTLRGHGAYMSWQHGGGTYHAPAEYWVDDITITLDPLRGDVSGVVFSEVYPPSEADDEEERIASSLGEQFWFNWQLERGELVEPTVLP